MIVFRNGKTWEAEADIDSNLDDQTMEYMATAIAAIDISVDMAIAMEA